jgi:hypothetical protein
MMSDVHAAGAAAGDAQRLLWFPQYAIQRSNVTVLLRSLQYFLLSDVLARAV